MPPTVPACIKSSVIPPRPICHVIGSVADEAAGTSYLVPRLCRGLAAHGLDITMLSTGVAQTSSTGGYVHEVFNIDWFVRFGLLRKLQSSIPLKRAVNAAVAAGAIVHNHGLWTMPNLVAAAASRIRNQPTIVSPHGMLAPSALEYSKFKKRLFLLAGQLRVLERADIFHATSAQEVSDIRAYGLTQPVALIPSGIDVPPSVTRRPPRTTRTLLYLGRLHPIKGLDTLLEAWRRIADSCPDWRLRVIGSGDIEFVESLKKQAQALERISIEGPLFGADKFKAYEMADLYVLPSRSENFAITVAEALGSGIPVIATKGTPWSKLEENGCGWWIEYGASALCHGLQHAMTCPHDELAEMGRRGHAWMSRDFSWTQIASQMAEVYAWLDHGGRLPSTIQLLNRSISDHVDN